MTPNEIADALEQDEWVESHTGRSTVEPELLKAAIAHLRTTSAAAAPLLDLIRDDAFAMSFQSLAQYRSALLKAAAPSQPAEPVNCCSGCGEGSTTDSMLAVYCVKCWEHPAAQAKQQPCRDDGRCQYAIDHGAEGLGHCPKGKCVMPAQQPQEALSRMEKAEAELEALRTRLAEPEQEPVAWMREGWGPDCGPYVDFRTTAEMQYQSSDGWTPLYTAPPTAAASRQQALEDAARVCEEHYSIFMQSVHAGKLRYCWKADGAEDCAAAIRKLKEET